MGKKQLRGLARAWEKKYDKRKIKRKDIPLCCQINPLFKCSYCDLIICTRHYDNMVEGAPGKRKYCPIPRAPERPKMIYDAELKKYVAEKKIGAPSKFEPPHFWIRVCYL
jgi:hypothetical protein